MNDSKPSHFSSHASSAWIWRYGVGIALAISVTLLQFLIDVLFDSPPLFTGFYLAVIIVAIYGGLGPTILTIVGLSLVAILPNTAQEHPETFLQNHLLEWLIFIAIGLGMGIWGERQLRIQKAHQTQSLKILERELQHKAINDSETHFRTIADTSPLFIWMEDAQNSTTFFSRGWLDFTGRTLDQELGRGWMHHIYADDYDPCVQQLAAAYKEQRAINIEYRIQRHDGEYRWILSSGTPRRDSAGNFIGYIGTCVDVTERKEAEKIFRLLAENALDILYHYQILPTPAYKYVSPSSILVTGYTPEEYYAEPSIDYRLIHPEDVPLFEAYLHSTESVNAPIVLRTVRKDGQVIWLEHHSRFLLDDVGRRVSAEGIARDVTTRVMAEKRIGLLQKITAAFSETMSIKQVAKVVNEYATVAFNARMVIIFQLNRSRTGLEVMSEHETPESVRENYPVIPLESDFPSAQAMRTSETIWLKNEADYRKHIPQYADQVLEQSVMAYAAIPLIANDRKMGVLGIGFDQPQIFDSETRLFILAFAQQCAQTMERVRLYESEREVRRAAERTADRIGRLQSFTESLSELLTPAQVAKIAIDQISATLNAEAALMLVLGEAAQELNVIYSTGYSPELLSQWHSISANTPHRMGQALRSGEIIWIEDKPETYEEYPLLSLALSDNYRMALLVPLVLEDQSVGGLVLSFTQSRTFESADQVFIYSLAQQCAQALERARLYNAERLALTKVDEARSRAEFLAQAGALLAASLEPATTFQRLTELIVPTLADWFVVSLIEDDKLQVRVVAHTDPAKIRFAQELQERFPPDPNSTRGAWHVVRTQQPIFFPLITEEMLQASAKNDEHLQLIREIGMTSAMIVPLRTTKRIIGAFTFVTAESSRRFSETVDLPLAQQLADRVSIALENAMLYQDVNEQREWFRVTLSSIGDAVIATDKEGHVKFMNTMAQTLTGWTEEAAIGHHLSEIFVIINEISRETVESPFVKVVREKAVVGLANHTILIARNGKEIAIDDSGAPIKDEAGKIIGVILVFRDIEERRKIEAAEREQRIMAESLQDTAVILNSTLDLPDVLNRILDNLERVIPHDSASIMLIAGTTAQIVGSHGNLNGTLQHELPLAQTPTLLHMLMYKTPFVVSNIAEYDGWVHLPDHDDTGSYMGAPLLVRDEVIGFLNVNSRTPNFFATNHTERLKAFAAQAATAIYNAQMYVHAQNLAVFEERQRLARDLHDAVTQTLFSSSIIAESLPRLAKTNPDRVLSLLDQLVLLNRGALAEMRNLLMELRPNNLINADIAELLKQLAEASMGRALLNISLKTVSKDALPKEVKITFYRIAQEAINNTVKHAKATRLEIFLSSQVDWAVLAIRDNGRGFDQTRVMSNHLGLGIMQERAKSIGASFQINSEPTQGTEIIVIWFKEPTWLV